MTEEATTILTFSSIDIPPWSARGLTQSLDPINQASNTRRTINGILVDTGDAAFRKYKTTIKGDDIDPPEIDDVWPGLIVTVGCIVELAYSATLPSKSYVSGSLREEAGFKYFRPQLTMMVIDFSVERDEYGAAVSWQIDLEEV